MSRAVVLLIVLGASWSMGSVLYAQNPLDYSHPGIYHAMLGELCGDWTYTGKHYAGNANPDSNKVVFQFGGKLVRRSYASGRFFLVELTGGRLKVPVADGKMEETEFKSMETEGYDNVKKKFELAVINNHIGSDIQYSEGQYDAANRTIVYRSRVELVPGEVDEQEEDFIFQDKDHYRIEYFDLSRGGKIKVHELICTRGK